MITDADRDQIMKAAEIEEKIGQLYIEQNAILNPIIKEAFERKDRKELKELFELLPDGPYRSEVRGFLNRLP